MNVTKSLSVLLAGAALAAAPAAANAADDLVAAAPGARSLTAGGGYLAWAVPAPGGGYRLTVRAANGTTTTPDVPAFAKAPHISIGSSAMTSGRRLVAVYDRDGDVFELDLATGAETKVSKVSSSATETQPSISYGTIAFVRKGRGTYVLQHGKVRRVTKDAPRLLAFNGTRIAYTTKRGVRLHRISGKGRDSYAAEGRSGVKAINLTRYSVTILAGGGQLFQSTRFGGSSDTDVIKGVHQAKRNLPASTTSFANDGGFVRYYADDAGVHGITRDEDIFDR